MSPFIYLPAALALLPLGVFVMMRVAAFRHNVIREPHAAPGADAGPLDFTVENIDGEPVALWQFKGNVVLIVNVASKCIFTTQYEGLQKLYETYKDRGLVIIGFPANNFGAQEPGTQTQIKSFCQTRFGVTFPMTAKVSVKGADQHPLFRFLTEPATAGPFAGEIKWNFAKFLVDRSGQVMARFGPGTKPENAMVIGAIEKAIAAIH